MSDMGCDAVLQKMEEGRVCLGSGLPMYMMIVVVTSEYAQMWLMLKPWNGGETGERLLLLCWVGKEGNGLLSCLGKSKRSTAVERY